MPDTPLDPETSKAIEKNIELVQTRLLAEQSIAPDAWAEAVAYLDGFIDRYRDGSDKTDFGALPSVIGSYLGEALVRTYGGQWIEQDGRPGVKLESGITAFPFAKAAKQFEDGEGDSINSFFTVIPALEKGSIERNGG
jgi:hypothetical protein